MKILGITAFYHDSSAALIDDGEIAFAIQEERLTRKKHDHSFPTNSIKKILSELKLKPSEIDYIVFFEKPFLKFERLLETYLAFAPKGFSSFSRSMPLWIENKLFQKKTIQQALIDIGFSPTQCKNLLFSDHHLSHASSAFFPSPFNEAIVLVMDGVGEWATTSVYIGNKNTLSLKKHITFPHSIGLLYSTFTAYCGFKVNSGEYKLMGLAPYGTPKYKDRILNHLIKIEDDGSFKLNMDYFNYCTGLTMFNKKFDNLFDNVKRESEGSLHQVHMDLAASIQIVTEEIILKLCHHLKTLYNISNLCLAGGVALNCVANGKIIETNLFDNFWAQPAAGDAGSAIGAALATYHIHLKQERFINQNNDSMKGSLLGNSYKTEEIVTILDEKKIPFAVLSDEELMNQTVEELNRGLAIGWFQGKMEFGPRSLGNRSILADPRNVEMQKNLNLKIKYRESFRPFAVSILEEQVHNNFKNVKHSPYMLIVDEIKNEHRIKLLPHELEREGLNLLNVKRSIVPAITHVNYTSRLQTVSSKTNPRFHQLLTAFFEKTQCPMLINTSFNVRGEPIVCSPEDAINCFLNTELDMLIMENVVIYKEKIPRKLLNQSSNQFSLD